jgi:hypothetical protein
LVVAEFSAQTGVVRENHKSKRDMTKGEIKFNEIVKKYALKKKKMK